MAVGKGLIHGKQIRDNSIPIEKLNFDINGNGGIHQYNGDYEMGVSASISGDNIATGLRPSADPFTNSAFYVHINGVVINIGDGVKNKSGYFSNDNGVTAQPLGNIGTQSEFFWNASIANYSLSTLDRVTFEYEIVATGGNADDFRYIFDQTFNSALWTINHSMAGYPSVTTVDNAGNVIEGQVRYLNDGTVTIQFNTPVSGRAYLS